MVADEPKQPEWPDNVLVFSAEPKAGEDYETHIQGILDKIKTTEDPHVPYAFVPPESVEEEVGPSNPGWGLPYPDWGSFQAKDLDEAQKIMDNAKAKEEAKMAEDPNYVQQYTYTSGNHFSTKRYALLFKSGEYKGCDFEIGYYVQMAGVGKTPNDVRFTGKRTDPKTKVERDSGPYVEALNKDLPCAEGGTIGRWNSGLCLDTFWRSAENFSANHVHWGVSQAAPLRKVDVGDFLEFGDGAAYSSGGFVANAQVGGVCQYAANQQWFSRGIKFGGDVKGGAWNNVFSGCTGNVPKSGAVAGDLVVSVEEAPKVRMEKPYVVMNGDDCELYVPQATTDSDGTKGPRFEENNMEVRCFSKVKVGKPILPKNETGEYDEIPDESFNTLTKEDEELTKELQTALDEGKDLVLCPGIFFLTEPLIVKKPNQVILGLGMATLIAPQKGGPCIRVLSGTAGVRIASLVLEASVPDDTLSKEHCNTDNVESLIDFGEPGKSGEKDPGDPSNPGLIADLFTRVGGSNLNRDVKTDVMVRIFSGNVIGDNLWLWRADHVKLKPNEPPNNPNFPLYHQVRIWEMDDEGNKQPVNECMCKNAIYVEGNDVRMYGLFAEHTTEDQMVWKGERGSVTFFQCELPYDVDESYSHCGYNVLENVKEHTGIGLGVYSNFTCFDVVAKLGLKFPATEKVVIVNPFTKWLAGEKGSGIENVLCKGDSIIGNKVCKPSQLARGWTNFNYTTA
eukprot:CAMPEP_0116131404 /NCGR_PEP_ID=MMETSP0329-20121206/8986_1 /TAXON_ID=697910 /ORGANISM="Pseudo-nitzschia arenysensis, Strain B593" /LENGTH=732 /DNA_ID=CAMNT_0003625829 /DNA_START=163 /DNA_END=2361 /DNA_ORIENTATION=-